jgi:2-polyprenyl-6-methoxyphenol hydroxylase-like FAD-dependent oxidoreductase
VITLPYESTPVDANPIAYRGKVRYGPDLRVLIVGGGIAGLTLAALLEQRGFSPLVIEKSPGSRTMDYVIGLWPAGSGILKGLKLFSRFCDVGLECARYVVANDRGDVLHSFSFEPVARRYGPLVDIGYDALVELLRSAISAERLRYGVTVREIRDTPEGARVVLSDGSAAVFDVVVGCDGRRSALRDLVFGAGAIEYAGITGWVFTITPELVGPPEVTEYWGAGRFVGAYPARGRLCVFAAAHTSPNDADLPTTRIERLRSTFGHFGGLVPSALAALQSPEEILHEDFGDVSIEKWRRGRTILIGDAAHATLPTSGMGASLAMESAAVLAEEFCRTDSKLLTYALDRYAARRRPRVDRVQARARRLGRVMFSGNALVTRLRDRAMRIMADEPLLDAVDDILGERI